MCKPVPKYENSRMAEAIEECIHSDRDRLILRRRLIDGWCFKDIEQEAHLERQQVGRIISRGSAEAFEYLERTR